MSERDQSSPGTSKQDATEFTPLVPKNGTGDGEGGNFSGGLSAKQTALLIAGGLAGSGVLALPRAVVKTGWAGIPMIVIIGAVAAFNGKRLADCWSIIEERETEMRSRKRNPYAIIAQRALGDSWSAVVSMAMIISQFGAAVVSLLLAAQTLEQIFMVLLPSVSICWWYLLATIALTPLLYFESPKDFPFLGLMAFGSVVIATVLYFVQMMFDIKPFRPYRYGVHGVQDFFLSFGIVVFAFGGVSTFPNTQNDMNDKTKFNQIVNYCIIGVMCLYLPIAAGAYAVYGESIAPSVSASLSATPVTLAGNIFMAVHLLSAFIILLNPVCQEIAELFKVPTESTTWRMSLRGLIMLAVLFLGESIPRFYTILSLIGGSTVALLSLVLPSLCYLKLCEPQNKQSPSAEPSSSLQASGFKKLFCWEVVILGLVGAVIAIFAAINAVFSTSQTTPCYLRF